MVGLFSALTTRKSETKKKFLVAKFLIKLWFLGIVIIVIILTYDSIRGLSEQKYLT